MMKLALSLIFTSALHQETVVPVHGYSDALDNNQNLRGLMKRESMYCETDILSKTQVLMQGHCLCKDDCMLCVTTNGLELHNNDNLWGIEEEGDADYLRMQADGNLVLYEGGLDDDHTPLWASGIFEEEDPYLQLEDGCCAVIKSGDGKKLWERGDCGTEMEMGSCAGEKLKATQVLMQGECLCKHECRLCVTSNGLELKKDQSVWNLEGDADYLRMQADGNLVLYEGGLTEDYTPLWATGIFEKGSYLQLENDCCAIVYSKDANELWKRGVCDFEPSLEGDEPSEELSEDI